MNEPQEPIIPKFILLLGSYDPDTKKLLYEIRNFIAKSFVEDVYALILEELEVYKGEENYFFMVEKGREPMLYAFRLYGLFDVRPLKITNPNELDNIVRNIVNKNYNTDITGRLPIIEKLEALAKSSELVLVIRDKQYSRCGEYIELTFLLEKGVDPRNVVFIVNKDIELSTMVKELLDYYWFVLRIYSSKDDLMDLIYRLVYYGVLRK